MSDDHAVSDSGEPNVGEANNLLCLVHVLLLYLLLIVVVVVGVAI